jgi:hypothetical protein
LKSISRERLVLRSFSEGGLQAKPLRESKIITG